MSVATANILGILALVFWSMNVAVTRLIGEAHPFGMPGLSFTISGILLIILDRVRGKPFPWHAEATWRFWLYGGGAFVAYLPLYSGGLSFSSSRAAALPLGLVNYFWPSLILVLMPFFFSYRVRIAILVAGLLLCVTGVGCALLWDMPLTETAALMRDIWPSVLMMLAAAFLWAFYSNAARKWGGAANGVGWFLLAGGLLMLGLWIVRGEPLGWSREVFVPLLIHALIINAAAYMLWDCGVRRGDIGLMGALANFLPLGSVLFGSWYLGGGTTAGLWIGGVLVTLGAVLCRRGLRKS